jgi:hypothetical protein
MPGSSCQGTAPRWSTAAKHGLSFFDALVTLTEGEPWMPAIT